MKDPLETIAEEGTPGEAKAAKGVLIAIVVTLVAIALTSKAALGIVLMIVLVLVTVMLHECGHFFVARRAGMKCTEFFVGFGPRLWSFTRGETEYGIKAVMLGGYVRIIGMNNVEEVAPEDEARTYRQAPTRWKLPVILAGVTVNFILCFVLLFSVFAIQGKGYSTAQVGTITKANSQISNPEDRDPTLPDVIPSQAAGLKKGDVIVGIDDQSFTGDPTTAWTRMSNYWKTKAGEALVFHIVRDGEPMDLTITPAPRLDAKGKPTGVGFVGLSPGFSHQSLGVGEAFVEAGRSMWTATAQTGAAFTRFFSPDGVKKQVDTVAGNGSANPVKNDRPVSVVGIVDFAGDVFTTGGIMSLLMVLAILNLALAIFNLIPLLPFDGGHAVIAIYESIASKVKKRKVMVDYRKLMPITAVVFVFIAFVGLTSIFLDVKNILH